MPEPILMPQVGQDLTVGKVVKWNVKPGDHVKRGDIVAIVESEKAAFEVEAFVEGEVVELLYAEGDTATVLQPILFIGRGAEAHTDEPLLGDNAKKDDASPPSNDAATATTTAERPAASGNGRIRTSPLARRLAEIHGIDLGVLVGTGPGHTIVKRDIDAILSARADEPTKTVPALIEPKRQRAELAIAPRPEPVVELRAPAPSPSGSGDHEIVFDRRRLVIAQRLSLSKRTIPHFYLHASADVTELQVRRRAASEISGVKVSINDVLIKAVALTLREFPNLNAHVSDDRMVVRSAINIGVAVAIDNGLMVPVIADADRKSVVEIAALARDYAASARRGVLKSIAVGSFSISNLGMYGVDVQPIINAPEAGILGVGPISRQVREHKGGLHVRDILGLTLSVDHRGVDGAYGAIPGEPDRNN